MSRLNVKTVTFLLLLIVGCGQPRSRVYGIVRYQGKPLTGGTIIFLASDNRTYPVKIQEDGSYQIAALPRGRIRVSIQSAGLRPSSRPQSSGRDGDNFAKSAMKSDDSGPKGRRKPPSAAPPSAIPPQYVDPNRSGLFFDLQSAEQEYSIDLK